jgi:hypothetical protein
VADRDAGECGRYCRYHLYIINSNNVESGRGTDAAPPDNELAYSEKQRLLSTQSLLSGPASLKNEIASFD